MKTYTVAQNPTDRKFYVIGYCGTVAGRAQYMPVSIGFASKKLAIARISQLVKADAAAKAECNI